MPSKIQTAMNQLSRVSLTLLLDSSALRASPFQTIQAADPVLVERIKKTLLYPRLYRAVDTKVENCRHNAWHGCQLSEEYAARRTICKSVSRRPTASASQGSHPQCWEDPGFRSKKMKDQVISHFTRDRACFRDEEGAFRVNLTDAWAFMTEYDVPAIQSSTCSWTADWAKLLCQHPQVRCHYQRV